MRVTSKQALRGKVSLLTAKLKAANFELSKNKDSEIESTLKERGARYGKFSDGAVIMQSLKEVMRNTDGWQRLTYSQKEALEMIQHKIGRVLNGDPTYDDNWRDICGFSQLILDELNKELK